MGDWHVDIRASRRSKIVWLPSALNSMSDVFRVSSFIELFTCNVSWLRLVQICLTSKHWLLMHHDWQTCADWLLVHHVRQCFGPSLIARLTFFLVGPCRAVPAPLQLSRRRLLTRTDKDERRTLMLLSWCWTQDILRHRLKDATLSRFSWAMPIDTLTPFTTMWHSPFMEDGEEMVAYCKDNNNLQDIVFEPCLGVNLGMPVHVMTESRAFCTGTLKL